jgi:hypothetical protein
MRTRTFGHGCAAHDAADASTRALDRFHEGARRLRRTKNDPLSRRDLARHRHGQRALLFKSNTNPLACRGIPSKPVAPRCRSTESSRAATRSRQVGAEQWRLRAAVERRGGWGAGQSGEGGVGLPFRGTACVSGQPVSMWLPIHALPYDTLGLGFDQQRLAIMENAKVLGSQLPDGVGGLGPRRS